MSRRRYLAAAALDRATALRPIARARELARAAYADNPPGPAADGFPIPPASLRVRVIGGNDPDGFLRGGRATADAILHTLDAGGIDPSQPRDVLDFGCGCGRVLRHLTSLPWTLSGCDINQPAVQWVNDNLPARASVNPFTPPAPYPGESFDLIYAISVLTHLTEPSARAWMAEWRRLLRPGGLLLISTIGDQRRHQLNRQQVADYDQGRPVVSKPGIEGMNFCVAHTPPAYVRDVLLDGWRLEAEVPGETVPDFPQDAWLARL